jgi:hypothetical protein
MPARIAGGGAALTAAVLAGVVTGLTAGPANAAPTNSTIVFTGGTVGVLVCASEPSTQTITITAGSKITFVNRLGQTADLKVGGQTVASVPNDQAVPITFHAGPVSVSMTFLCSLVPKVTFRAVAVNVDPAVAPTTPAPAGTTAGAAPPSQGGGSGLGTTSGPGAGGAPTAPHNAAPVTAGRSTPNVAPPRALATPPIAGASDRAGSPAASDLAAMAAVPPVGVGPLESAGATPSTPEVFAVGPLEPAGGTPSSGPTGLLALLAAVCAAGVTIAAFRVILLQRTIRAQGT